MVVVLPLQMLQRGLVLAKGARPTYQNPAMRRKVLLFVILVEYYV